MKKFLSLVLALIMTMSLVTIGAGATEYRDLTDKDEIQYEEAVAVLNRIGVITGYEDGSFRPETELTRGAAAKIIVSLLIGPEAASNLPNATAPYPDVPASHTFAGVISYCKTAGIISGYGDGTFKPGNSLTGFAFAKMLLGALGYKSEIEGFVDTGWTMNVARVGNVTGLFDRLDFDGSASVNREEACQLALNTLKATMVTYGGTTLVTGAQTLAVQGTQAMYVTSNNREINANINRRVINATNNEMTLEFGEEHFKDLRLEHDKYDPAYDDFGHPSNEWSWKKVTIGTFKLPADFTFTKQMSHLEDTDATKEKAVGLRNYDTYSTDHRGSYANWSSAAGGINYAYSSPFENATQITINGWDARVDEDGRIYTWDAGTAKEKADAPTIAEIADLTDNGVTVEVYVCPVDADFITNVVVTRTQLMKVKRLGSDYVTLEDVEPDSRGPRKDSDLAAITGYNAFAIDVTESYDDHASSLSDVKDSNYEAYNVLKDMKTGDYVAVVPYTTDDGKNWEVGEAYAPETVSGTFTKVDTYANVNKKTGSAVAITVGGTSYPINEWNKDMLDVKGNEIKATKKDVTLYLAKDGTVLWADEIGNSDDWMVVGDYYQATGTNGKVGWFVHGWTTGGDEVDLDLGTIRGDAEKYAPGELVRYYIAEDGNGEYALEKPNYNKVSYNKDGSTNTEPAMLDKDGNSTGEGIYEVSQYTINSANTNQSMQYEIIKRNGALAVEGYDSYKHGAVIYDTTGKPDANGDATVKDTDKTDGDLEAHPFKYANLLYDGVKFIFVNFDGANGEVETIDFQSGVQNVNYSDLVRYNDKWKNVGTNNYNFVVSAAEAYVNDKGVVKAVVIKADSSEADLSKIAVITDTPGDKNNSTGAEGDRPTGVSYAKQYVTGPNFNISEEKTGWFDKDYAIGTILVISEKDNLIIGKNFHSTYYNNGNPDGVFVNGITALTRPNGGTSKAGFLIGQGTNKVYTLNERNELTENMPTTSTVLPDGTGIVQILTNKFVSGADTQLQESELKGLVRVDGTTKFIDLRAINNDTIDDLDDLLEYDPATVQLRILLDGAVSTDLFRHAYVVIVEHAGAAKQVAATPAVDVTAMDGGVKVPDADITVTAATATANKKVTITAPAGDTVTLGANVTNVDKCGTLSAFTWKNAIGQTISAPVSVVVPASPNEATFTVSVTNTDKDKKDQTTATTVVDIVVKAKAGEGPVDPSAPGSVKDYTTGGWDNSTSGLKVNVTKSGTVSADHKLTVAFDIDRTAAVDANGRVIPADNAVPTKISYDIYAGDALVKSVANDTAVALGNLAAGSEQTLNALVDSSANLTVKVTGVVWSAVKVYYVFQNVPAAITTTPAVTDAAPKSLVKATVDATATNGNLMSFSIKTGTTEGEITKGTITFTVTGFDTTNAPTCTAGASVSAANNITSNASTATTLLGTAPVVVTIDATAVGTTLTKYAVSANTLTEDIADVASTMGDMTAGGDGDTTITVAPEKAAGDYDKGTSLDLMVYTSAAIAEVAKLNVTVKDAAGNVVGTTTVGATNTTKATGAVIHTTINADVDCSTMTVEVTPINFLKAQRVELVNDTLHTYRIHFDRALAGTAIAGKFTGTTDGTAANANNATAAVNEGSSVLITVPAAVANNGTIIVTASGGPVDADGVGLKGTTTTFTYTTAGGWGAPVVA